VADFEVSVFEGRENKLLSAKILYAVAKRYGDLFIKCLCGIGHNLEVIRVFIS
jgi:hypothetical protein